VIAVGFGAHERNYIYIYIYIYINKIDNNIKLNPTYEEHNSIAFLDLTITRTNTKLEVDIYRKPTTTDTTINFHSNHPTEQKTAAFRLHITRMHSLPLNPDKKQTEWEITQSVSKNNNFPQHLLLKLNRQILHKVNNKKLARMTKKIWTTFTFHSPKIRKITNLLKKYEYRHSVQDYNNIAPSHKTHSTNPVTRT